MRKQITTAETRARIVELWVKYRLPVEVIAERVGRSRNNVTHSLRSAGIKVSSGPQRRAQA